MSEPNKIQWITPAASFYDRMGQLYKYRAFNDQSLSLLIDAELFCASPSILNDPYDSQIDIQNSLRGALEWILGEEPKFPKSYEEALGLLESGKADAMCERAVKSGICSFSTIPDNTLMWSHYADQHRGFCIGMDPLLFGGGELSTHFPDNTMLQPVTYTDGNPMAHAVQAMNHSAYITVGPGRKKSNQPPAGSLIRHASEAALYTKNLAWSYENEVRLIHRDGQKSVPIKRESIRQIIFGCRMPERNRSTLRNLAAFSGLSHVQFFELKKSETDLSFAIADCD